MVNYNLYFFNILDPQTGPSGIQQGPPSPQPGPSGLQGKL